MTRKKRAAILRPPNMPLEFEFHGRRYRWYRNLARSRKRYLIRLFHQHSQEINPILIDTKKEKPLILGISFIFWDERAGPKILGKWPSTVEISKATIMQIYANYIGLNIDGFLLLENEKSQFCAFQIITCEENRFFLILVTQNISFTEKLEVSLQKIADLILKNPHYLLLTGKNDNQRIDQISLDCIIELGEISPEFLELMLKNLNRSVSKHL